MKIDVLTIVKTDGASLPVSVDMMIDKISFNGQDYVFTAPVKVEGIIKNTEGNLYLDAQVRTQFKTVCARCLDDIIQEFEFSLSEVYTRAEVDEDSLFLPIVSDTIDLQAAVEDNFCTSLPVRFLCREDCKGLCHICGKNLNEGECGCNTEEIDPRMAGLKDFLKNN